MGKAYREQFRSAVDELRKGDLSALDRMAEAYGNISMRWPYLAKLYDVASSCSGPFLEFGSGLSTIVLGVIAEQKKTRLISIDETKEWGRRAESVLALCGLTCVDVYIGTPQAMLPKLRAVDFVMVDGPMDDDLRISIFTELSHIIANASIVINAPFNPVLQPTIESWAGSRGLSLTAEAAGRYATASRNK